MYCSIEHFETECKHNANPPQYCPGIGGKQGILCPESGICPTSGGTGTQCNPGTQCPESLCPSTKVCPVSGNACNVGQMCPKFDCPSNGVCSQDTPPHGGGGNPPQGEIGWLIIDNNSGKNISVWLDDRPPCMQDQSNCSWDNNLFQGDNKYDYLVNYVVKTNGSQELQPQLSRHQDLLVGEKWKIAIPVNPSTGYPVWCSPVPPQKNGVATFCKGTGGWIVPMGIEKPDPGGLSRFEINFNDVSPTGNKVYYNLSGVDGVNSMMEINHSSCPSLVSSCSINLDTCPEDFKGTVGIGLQTPGPIKTCLSTKSALSIAESKGLVDVNPMVTISGVEKRRDEWAGCDTSMENTKCRCHMFWDDNSNVQDKTLKYNAKAWTDWINPPSKSCDMYAWAYGEKKVLPDVNPECCNDPALNCNSDGNVMCAMADKCIKDNPFHPLFECVVPKHNPGTLTIKVNDVMV